MIALGLATTIDTQDKTPYPHRGAFLEAGYVSSQAPLGSQIPFSRIHFMYDLFLPVWHERFTLHPRVHFGFGDRTMPHTEAFRLGGMQTFYGMRENEYTGRQLFLGSLELRYLLPEPFLFETSLSLRYDLGRTWEIPEQIKFGTMRHGLGIAVGLDTPIGPADFGIGRSFVFMHDKIGNFIKWGPIVVYFSVGFGI